MAAILKSLLNHDQIFNALGDPTRRAIVDRLSQGSSSVSELAKPLGLTLAAIGQHLQVLEACGIVTTEKAGRVRSCRLDQTGLRAAERWLAERRMAWERNFDRLAEILDPDKESP
ncbi:MAG: Transcriptional regulator, ArsR family protein [Cyanobacteria bacterium RYN_339]|nr:Transcriptional regulator, ArsR family protein [Cyanobacteria bacterium RYN_339]